MEGGGAQGTEAEEVRTGPTRPGGTRGGRDLNKTSGGERGAGRSREGKAEGGERGDTAVIFSAMAPKWIRKNE